MWMATRATALSSLPTHAEARLRPALLYPWFASLSSLRGIGAATLKSLQALLLRGGDMHAPVVTRDLLFHLPTGTIDRSRLTSVANVQKGSYASLQLQIDEHIAPPRIKRRLPYKIIAHDATGTVVITYFHVKGDYLARQLPVGATRIVCGVVDWYDGLPTIAHPDLVALPEKANEVLALSPLYPLTQGISQRLLAKASATLVRSLKDLPEWLDGALLAEQKWPSFVGALRALHTPVDAADVVENSAVRARLAYDELLANQLALALSRQHEKRQATPALRWDEQLDVTWMSLLPFELTPGQQQVLSEIASDLASGQRMLRLLQGDVGSGKTILAFAAMAQLAAQGFQAVLMAPTDVLARQHVHTLQPLAEALRIPLALLSGKMKAAERASVLQGLASGALPLVIGTHAVFQDQVVFKRLGLLVIDEQHRFGVSERLRLSAKADAPHVLQMTATPIPRSLTMTLYGDMDVSVLTERPPGRQPIDTRAVPFSRIQEVIEGVGRVIHTGEKLYWVCPLIEDSDASDLAAAQERFKQLHAIFPGKVGLVHGRMKLAEREKVMHAFAFGDLQLLVATTVIEVGVNVPQATVMVIEHAERFGLAQLHQLRGRVGRSEKASRCILLYHHLSGIAKERIAMLRQTNDGFAIAEKDLQLRGEGDVLGTRQTGLPDFKLANMSHHIPLIRIAHNDARLVLYQDPDLLSPRGRALRLLLALFEYDEAVAKLKAV